MTDPVHRLAQAVEAARAEAGPAPAVLRRRVVSAAARLHRPGRRVRVERPGGVVWVSERVADAAVGRALAGIGLVPLAASLSLDGDRAVAATVVVGVAYGTPIGGPAGAAEAARAASSAALRTVLGAVGGRLTVRVVVGDVVAAVDLGRPAGAVDPGRPAAAGDGSARPAIRGPGGSEEPVAGSEDTDCASPGRPSGFRSDRL